MRKANKLMLAAVMAIALPTGALAAEADLQAKIDKLTAQMDDLKGQVQKLDDKSLGKWLHIGGDYRFRVDYVTGQTAAYSNAIGTLGNMVNGMVAGKTIAVNPSANLGTMNTAIAGTYAGGAYTLNGVLTDRRVLNPTATDFMFQGKSGQLFTSQQFGTIMNSYMPSAMYTMFFGQQATWNSNNVVGGNYTLSTQASPQMDFSTAKTLQSMGFSAENSIKYESAAGKFASIQALQDGTIANYASMMGMTVDQMAQAMFGKTTAQIMADGATMQAASAAMTPQQQNILNTLKAQVLPKMMQMMTPNQQAMMQQMMSNPAMASMAYNYLMQGFLGAGSGNLAQYQAARPTNDTLYTNRFGLDLKGKVTQDVTVNVRLLAYKVFGSQDSSSVNGNGGTPYFADRVGIFDGVLGHVPSTSYLNVDRAYATWSNILDQPIWFSVGRRPATDGSPLNFKNNTQPPGNGGTPALLVNYAFDGMTIGYAPDIEMLPGFYAKVCYGRGFESGLNNTSGSLNSLKDTDMLGVAIIPVDTEPLRIWTQWNRGFDIFDFPVMNNTAFGNTGPSTTLGAIDWFGIGASSTLKKVGPGDLNFFVDTGMSITHPTNNVSNNAGFQGLLSGEFFAQDFNPKAKTGYAIYTGLRYDLPTRTKIGFEYNYGSKYWITFSPAADDMWTSKVGTRGQVFEPYVIQELDLKPISSMFAKAFFKLGYQYYAFDYTGSNNWVGAPMKISDIKPTDLMLMTPVKRAQNIYGTFEVHF